MGCTYVKEFKFGGEVKPKTPPAVKAAVHKHEKAQHPNTPTPRQALDCIEVWRKSQSEIKIRVIINAVALAEAATRVSTKPVRGALNGCIRYN